MLGNRSRPRIALPKQWPNRVRSGVLHAISLAHFSLTFTRSWAANSWNARIRLKQENDRFREELALLREEMRIKDDRTIRRSSDWLFSSCGQPADGLGRRPPGVSSSPPLLFALGWAGWTRKAQGPSFRHANPSTSFPTSSPTPSAGSRCSALPWAKSRSRRFSAAQGCI